MASQLDVNTGASYIFKSEISIPKPASRRCATRTLHAHGGCKQAGRHQQQQLQRVAASAPDGAADQDHRTSPLDPLVWRKLDPAVKTKLYTFLPSMGASVGQRHRRKGVLSTHRSHFVSRQSLIDPGARGQQNGEAQPTRSCPRMRRHDRLRLSVRRLKSSRRCRRRQSPTSSRSGRRPCRGRLATRTTEQDDRRFAAGFSRLLISHHPAHGLGVGGYRRSAIERDAAIPRQARQDRR